MNRSLTSSFNYEKVIWVNVTCSGRNVIWLKKLPLSDSLQRSWVNLTTDSRIHIEQNTTSLSTISFFIWSQVSSLAYLLYSQLRLTWEIRTHDITTITSQDSLVLLPENPSSSLISYYLFCWKQPFHALTGRAESLFCFICC